jgi:hypothetical protein
MRKRYPAAIQLVYDNYNALAIGFGASEKASQAIFSIAIFPRGELVFSAGRRIGGSGQNITGVWKCRPAHPPAFRGHTQ